MPIKERDNGRASSAYSERALYDLVAEVTRYVSPSRPETVSQRAFDRARAGAGHPDAPTARGICMRLGDNGKSMSWARLRQRALLGDFDHDRSHGRHRGQAPDPDLDVRHLVFALRFAASEAELLSLAPDRYETIRRELLRRDRRRHRRHDHHHDPLLPNLLPSKGQIERIARDHDQQRRAAAAAAAKKAKADAAETNEESASATSDSAAVAVLELELEEAPAEPAQKLPDWDRALELAGLEPRRVLELDRKERRRRSNQSRESASGAKLPLAEAIHHFLEANGELPSHRRLEDFARQLEIAIEIRSKPWAEHLEDARAYRAGLGLSSPAEGPKPRGHAVRKELKVPAGGIPGAPPRHGRGRSRYSEADCIAALRRFDRELPAREPRTRARYLEFSVREGTVPPNHFDRYGGFTRLMRKARQENSSIK